MLILRYNVFLSSDFGEIPCTQKQLHNGSIPMSFGQDQIRSGERRTLFVIIMTGLMMVGEIAAGIIFGSMALTADGIHMGSHMIGLGITFFAYIYARKHAHDQRFSFGTGKVNALAGYSSAMILIFIALFMAYESIIRIINPVEILIIRPSQSQ